MTTAPPPRGDIWMAVVVIILIGVLSGGWLLWANPPTMADIIDADRDDPKPATVKCAVFETDGDSAAMCFVSGDVDFAWIDANATENGTVSLSGLPTNDSTTRSTRATPTPTPTSEYDTQLVEQTFRFRNGDVRMEFPLTVRFDSPEGTNWTTHHRFTVEQNQPFTVSLERDTHYRIMIEDSVGERRMIGAFNPQLDGKEMEVLIGGCCVDTFE